MKGIKTMSRSDLELFKNLIAAIIEALENNEPKEKIIKYLKSLIK